MSKTHIIYIPFTGVGKYQYKGDDWFKNRIEIFKNYTLKSLLNQTNKDYHLWLSFREEEMNKSEVNDLIRYLDDLIPRTRLHFTFNGLMYWDDRNEEKNKDLYQRLETALFLVGFQLLNTDFVYLTRLDSDDMLSKMAVEHIQHGLAINVESLVFKKGYIYNKDRDELAEWHPETNPPFHTLIMDRETFLDPKKHLAFYKNFKSHEDITKQFTYLTLPDYQYCVVIHGQNLSTTWEHRFRGRIIENHQEILKEFGI